MTSAEVSIRHVIKWNRYLNPSGGLARAGKVRVRVVPKYISATKKN
jgi:hypothetical protein